MEIRDPEPDESERIREVVDSSMTTSFRLSPQQIDAITDEQFADEAVTDRLEAEETVIRVAETDEDVDEPAIVGVAEGTVDGEWADLNWLFVDPEHRGRGIGTELYEATTETLRDRGADHVRVTVLEANTEGHQFVERFGLEHDGERQVDIAEETFVKYVYTDPDVDADLDIESAGENVEPTDEQASDEEFPGTDTDDGTLTATTEGGAVVYVARGEEESGTADSFFTVYENETHANQYGFYCANCGSLDVSMDNMERLECGDCGNSHAERSKESYDDSHL